MLVLVGLISFGQLRRRDQGEFQFDSESVHPVDNFEICPKFSRSRPTATLALSNDWLKNMSVVKSRRGGCKSKSTFDLSPSGRTKCRADLIQKVSSAGLRKSLSKSREQLWKSKVSTVPH